MKKTLEQLKIDRQKPSIYRLLLWLIGQHWRLDAIIYYAEIGYAIEFAKKQALKIKSKNEFLAIKDKSKYISTP